MGQEDSCKETNAEDGLVKFDSFVEEHNGRVSEGGLDDFVDSDKNGGNVISEGVGGVANVEKDVKSEVKDDVDVKRSDVVGVKSGEILNVECGGDKSCEIVDGEGDGVVGVSGFVGKCGIGGTLGIGSDGTKSGEKVSDKSESESEASSESDFEASSESDSEASSESDSEASGESESESSSPSLSESSSEEEEDDDDDDGEMMDKTWEEVSRMVEDMFIQEMLDWSDEVRMFELAELLSMSANKAKVPPVSVTLQPCHETLPVGVVLSVVGAQVIVQGVENHDPLNEGSILWITEKRSPLGIVDYIFGPVKNPYYIVRYNSKKEVPAGVQYGTLISFVSEFANHVLNNGNLHNKGYDASGKNYEELSDEAEFSDNEKEAEYKRMQKVSKRGPKAQVVENRKDTKNKAKRKADQHLTATQPNKRIVQVPSNQSQHFPPSLLDPGNFSNSLHPVQAFPGGPGFVPMFPQVTQVPNFVAPSSGIWMNRFPFQPPRSMGFPSASTPNNILQFHQNLAQHHHQMLSFNGMPLQQQYNTGQMLPSNFVHPGGQPSFGAGAAFAPMNPMMMGHQMLSFNGMPLQQQFNTGQMLPSNFVHPGGQPSFGAGATFTPMNPMMIYNFGQFHAAMSQNNFSQSQHAINMQGQNAINFSQAQAPVQMQRQHVPSFVSTGQQGVLLTGCQSEQNSNSQPLSGTAASTGDSQDRSNSVGAGLASKSHRKGCEQFEGGRDRRQSR